MTKDAKRLFNTLTRAQQAIWARAIKAGYKPVVVNSKNKKKKILRMERCMHIKCFKNAIVFKKGKKVYAVCSSGHFTRLEK